MHNVVPEEERGHGIISNKTYFKYIQEGGNTILTILLVLVFIVAEVILLFYCVYIMSNLLLLG